MSAAADRSVVFAALVALSGAVWAAGPAGEVTHVSGAFMATRPDGTSRVLAPKSKVQEGDVLTAADNTYARVKFTDGGEVTLRPNTRLVIEAYRFEPQRPQSDNFIMRLFKGGLRSITGLLGKRRSDSYQMRTPVATIGIRGTHYGALLCQGDCGTLATAGGQAPKDGLHVDVAEGAVSVTNGAGQAVLAQGTFGYVPNARTVPVQVPPSQGITVTVPPPSTKAGGPLSFTPPGSPLDEDCIAQ